MADPTSRVALTVDGMDWYGWKAVQIERSMESAAGKFTLGLTERWAGSERRRIGPGAACVLTVDGEIVVKGYVDDAQPSYDAENHELTVSGRDATGDLVDCAVLPPYEFRDLTLTEIAARLGKPFGIGASADIDVGKPFERFSIQPGETAFEAIDRGALMRGAIAIADGRGGLKLTRAGMGFAPDTLELGRNVISARGNFTFKDRFSDYKALGQQEGSDAFADASEASAPSALVKDEGVKRYRPTIVLGEMQGDGATLKQRAEWMKAVSAGQSKRATYTVQGWRAKGRLWRPNERVTVIDAYVNLDGAELMIPKVTMLLTEAGTFTQIEVAPLDTYREEPGAAANAEKSARASSGKASGGKSSGGSGDGAGDAFSLWD